MSSIKVDISPTEYLRVLEFSARSVITHAKRMKKAEEKHLRTITNGNLAEVACVKHLKNEGLIPAENVPDFRIYPEVKDRDTGDLRFENSEAVVDVKAAEFYSSWLMVKEADLCQGVVSDAYFFCTPKEDFPPKLDDSDYPIPGEFEAGDARARSFRKLFWEYPDIDLKKDAPEYEVHGGARLREVVAEKGSHPPKAIGPIKDVRSMGEGGDVPEYSHYSEYYSREEYERYIEGISKVAGEGNELDNYNRFLHSDELDLDIAGVVWEGPTKLDEDRLVVFFRGASEDLGRPVRREDYLEGLEQAEKEDQNLEVDQYVEEYDLRCGLCEKVIGSVPDGMISISFDGETRDQKNISGEKVAGISRAFVGEELCFECLSKKSDAEEVPLKLKL